MQILYANAKVKCKLHAMNAILDTIPMLPPKLIHCIAHNATKFEN